jgi:hypothetical protein
MPSGWCSEVSGLRSEEPAQRDLVLALLAVADRETRVRATVSLTAEDWRVIAKSLRHERTMRLHKWRVNGQRVQPGVVAQIARIESVANEVAEHLAR